MAPTKAKGGRSISPPLPPVPKAPAKKVEKAQAGPSKSAAKASIPAPYLQRRGSPNRGRGQRQDTTGDPGRRRRPQLTRSRPASPPGLTDRQKAARKGAETKRKNKEAQQARDQIQQEFEEREEEQRRREDPSADKLRKYGLRGGGGDSGEAIEQHKHRRPAVHQEGALEPDSPEPAPRRGKGKRKEPVYRAGRKETSPPRETAAQHNDKVTKGKKKSKKQQSESPSALEDLEALRDFESDDGGLGKAGKKQKTRPPSPSKWSDDVFLAMLQQNHADLRAREARKGGYDEVLAELKGAITALEVKITEDEMDAKPPRKGDEPLRKR